MMYGIKSLVLIRPFAAITTLTAGLICPPEIFADINIAIASAAADAIGFPVAKMT